MRLIRFAWRHPRATALAAAAAAVALAGFSMSVRTGEGDRRFLLKRLTEVQRMPGRLLT